MNSSAAGRVSAKTPWTLPTPNATARAGASAVDSNAQPSAVGAGASRSTALSAFLWGAVPSVAMSLTSSSSAGATAGGRADLAALGVTFDAEGVPDFSAITAAGGKVTGCLPPDGQSCFILRLNGHATVQYAVEIDKGDGSQPLYAKGVSVSCDDGVGGAQRRDAWACAVKIFQDMPDSLEDARARCWMGRSAWSAPQRSVDVTA